MDTKEESSRKQKDSETGNACAQESLRDKIDLYWTNRAEGYSLVNQEELAGDVGGDWAGVIGRRIRSVFPGQAAEQISVLDIGTGPGFFAILLAGAGYSVTAVDYTEAMLDEAKKNAGDLAEKIRFFRMDAQELEFPDASFDVILSRNLTWNLPHPKKAYASWLRVLKRGGLMLNFDANWYTWMYDRETSLLHQDARKTVEETGIRNFDTDPGIDADAMTDIVRQVPLSRQHRPEWDIRTLKNLGLTDAEIRVDTEIWQSVWSESEKINYSKDSPMFLVEVKRNR